MRKWAGLFALAGLAFGLGHGFAQPGIPDGSFVRDSGGNVWLVTGGQRAGIPLYPTTDEQILAIPDSGLFVVPATDGSGALTLGPRPTFGNGQAPGAGTNPLPQVTIQIDDETINPNQTITVTVIASDDTGLEWIEWEGTIVEGDNENDNRATGDPALDGRKRHDCDDQRQCANVWTVTPTKSGRYTLRARALDVSDGRSAWVSVSLRVR
jgi:hypothetical protein